MRLDYRPSGLHKSYTFCFHAFQALRDLLSTSCCGFDRTAVPTYVIKNVGEKADLGSFDFLWPVLELELECTKSELRARPRNLHVWSCDEFPQSLERRCRSGWGVGG